MGKVLLKTTVRETPKESKLADRVARKLTRLEGEKFSKQKAYIRAMSGLAFQIGL